MRFQKYLFLRNYQEFKPNKSKISKGEGRVFLLLSLVFIALAFWSWRKWPDILIDFGRELYIPWQLASGKVLYKNIAFFNGPFSQYFNGLIFYLFGTSFISLVLSNLVIAALFTLVIYLFFEKACDQYTAVFSSLVFLTFFGFAHLTKVGNYNWICPYSHELTHGIALSCVMLLILQNCFLRFRLGLLALAGICLGCILLTKMEVALAAVASAIVGNTLIIWTLKPRLSRGLILISTFLLAMLIPIVGFLAFLSRYMPLKEAVQGVSISWRAIFETPVMWNKFYLTSVGLDFPLRSIVFMATGSVGILLFVCAAIMIDVRESSSVKKRRAFIILATGFWVAALTVKFCPGLIFGWSLYPMTAIITGIFAGNAGLLIVGWALPSITLIFGASLVWLFITRPDDSRITSEFAPLIIWAVFSFILLAKIFLHPRLYHYGFALAMPATILLVAGFLWLLPKALKRLGGTGLTFRRIMAAALLVDIFLALISSQKIYSLKFFDVGQGGDRILTYQTSFGFRPSGPSIAELLKEIENLIPQHGNFAVIPEGIMINYLSRRPNSTRYTGLTPPEIIIYGQGNILKSFLETPPDFIISIPRGMAEYGVDLLGEDSNYGKNIMAWISQGYEKVWQEPEELQPNDRFRICILRRKALITNSVF